ncbi:alpha/beta hydrolase [Aliiroseovarius sp. 2305UL8-7]|uniref:alpha/beta hydrolase n=1 Tax=Aliiroseovarius conchicola TaxID=3121637 RepID=UPI003529716F
MSIFQIAGIGIVICVLSLFGGIAVFQKTAVYKFSPEPMHPADYDLSSFRDVTIETEHDDPLRVWVSDPKPGKAVIISFYGNFSQLGPSVKRLKSLVNLGYGIAVMEYRGSAKGAARAGEAEFARDANALYDKLDSVMGETIGPNNRVLHGFSLGTSIATQLAANRPAAALILESGFDQLCRFQARRWKGLPACKLMWAERHDVINSITSVDMPILVAHGALDQAIPLPWSEALFDAAPAPKEFMLYDDGAHGDLLDKGLADDIEAFLDPYVN